MGGPGSAGGMEVSAVPWRGGKDQTGVWAALRAGGREACVFPPPRMLVHPPQCSLPPGCLSPAMPSCPLGGEGSSPPRRETGPTSALAGPGALGGWVSAPQGVPHPWEPPPPSPVIPTQGCLPPCCIPLCHPPLGHPPSPHPRAGCRHPLGAPSPQDDYHKLLTKYAEAENTIDQLRLGARVGARAGMAAGGAGGGTPGSASPSLGLFRVSSSPGPPPCSSSARGAAVEQTQPGERGSRPTQSPHQNRGSLPPPPGRLPSAPGRWLS